MLHKPCSMLVIFSLIVLSCGFEEEIKHPNVVLIMTDDQGYGDLAFHGNQLIKTPFIDEFARNSVRLTNFYVSPVCAPTRASLMTGRYSLRTGVRDTYNGGAIMASSEITIAEMLKQSDYRTGIFGKWHLGDSYPSRTSDQGFDESLIHLAGGIGQVGDITTYFEGDSSYFNPVLWRNGKKEKNEGYCSDIFARNAIRFIEENKDAPFFCYLSFNAPHIPLQVPDEYYQPYASIDPSIMPNGEVLKMSKRAKEDARRAYAMVTNIDDNVGKLLNRIEELGIKDNTIVIFMTDNGPQRIRYNGNMRDRKSSVYRGGNRVPFFMSYPARFDGNIDIDLTTAHIDVLPTLAELCNVSLPKNRIIDGKNLTPLINGGSVEWADRSFFSYCSRRYPELYKNMAIQKADYKLVGQTNSNASIADFELYNIKEDPSESKNLISQKQKIALTLKEELDTLYYELVRSENLLNPPGIILGTQSENPTILNRNDADGERRMWNQEEIYGKWNVTFTEGYYDFEFKFIKPIKARGQMYLETNTIINQIKNNEDTDVIEMKNVYLPQMDAELIPFYEVDGKRILPLWITVEKTNL